MKMMHVTIRTDKFEEEMKFYEDVAWLVPVRDLRPLGRNMIFLANREGETRVEIIEMPGAVDAGNANLSVGFLTEDAEAKREELLAAGMEVSEITSPVPQVQFFFVKDPAGVNVQFLKE